MRKRRKGLSVKTIKWTIKTFHKGLVSFKKLTILLEQAGSSPLRISRIGVNNHRDKRVALEFSEFNYDTLQFREVLLLDRSGAVVR